MKLWVHQKNDSSKYAHSDWKSLYDENILKQKQAKEELARLENEYEQIREVNHVRTVHHTDAQGGMLNIDYIDSVYCNVMRVHSISRECKHVVVSDVDAYFGMQKDVLVEQHRLNLAKQVTMEDMKMENRYYGNTYVTLKLPRLTYMCKKQS